jgi:hypothetical protein
MPTSTIGQVEVPGEMRAVAERSIQSAKLAFDNYIKAIQATVSVLDARVEAGHLDAQEIAKTAMSFALRNAIAAFEFAQRIVQAKSIPEFSRLLNEFLRVQMQVMNEQVRSLSETLSRAAIEGVKPSQTRGRAS